MTRIAPRIATLIRAGSAAVLLAAPALAATPPTYSPQTPPPERASAPVQGWPALAGSDLSQILAQLDDLPLSDQASHQQLYCASDTEIVMTLRDDFAEEVVITAGAGGTELWASDLLGTWTVVAPREDATSCIVASGIGFQADRDAELYYSSLGL